MDNGNYTYERPGDPDLDSRKAKDVLLYAILILLSLVTVVGNAMVMVAVCLVPKLQRPENLLIISLAIADELIGIVVMPVAAVYEVLEYFPFGSVVCNLWISTDITACSASILSLCVISFDRYLVISRPLRYGPKRTVRCMVLSILSVWILSVIISVPPVIFYGNTTEGNTCLISQEPAYQIYATITAFYAPTLIMMIAYVNILVLVRKILRTERHLTAVPSAPRGFDGNGSSVHMSLLNGKQVYPRPNNALTLQRSASAKSQDYAYRAPSSKKSSMESRELKAIRTLTAIAFAFLISWLPFFVVALIRPFYPGVPKWISGLTYWAGLSNSAINPILYSVFNADFRRPFAELLRCRCWSLRKTMRAESYESQFGDTTRASFRSRTSPKTDRNIHNEAIFFKTRSDSTVQENEL